MCPQLHAKLGELLYMSTDNPESPEATLPVLAESVRRFCRSIELCDDYLRGYYGLKLVCPGIPAVPDHEEC
jgi:hypothetical protein